MQDKLRIQMDEAQMADEDGVMARALLPGHIMLPSHVEIQSNMLAWCADQEWNGRTWPALPRQVRADGPILDQFVRLSSENPAMVKRFAERWGMFGDPQYWERWRDTTTAYQGREPLSMWDDRVAQVRTILRIAARLHQSEPTDIEDWRVALTRGVTLPDHRVTLATIEHHGHFNGPWTPEDVLAELVNDMIVEAKVKPRLSWTRGGTAEVALQGRGVGAAIAMQLAAAIAKGEGIFFCNSCGNPYTPDRRPRNGERRYCPGCRTEGIPQRDAARDLRERKKAKGDPAGKM